MQYNDEQLREEIKREMALGAYLEELKSLLKDGAQRFDALPEEAVGRNPEGTHWANDEDAQHRMEQIWSDILANFRELRTKHNEIDYVAFAVRDEQYRTMMANIMRCGYEASKRLEYAGDEGKWQEWRDRYGEYVKACADIDVNQDMQTVYDQFRKVYARYDDMVQPEDWELLAACPCAQKS
jgi:hypothetical protein